MEDSGYSSPVGRDNAVICELKALTKKLKLGRKNIFNNKKPGAEEIPRVVEFFESSLTKLMDQYTNQLFELFKTLLNNLNLPEDIFGYSACLILLTILLFVKSVVVSCIVRKLKSCKINQEQFDISDLEIA